MNNSPRKFTSNQVHNHNRKKFHVYEKWRKVFKSLNMLYEGVVSFPITYKTWSDPFGAQYEGLTIKCNMQVNNQYDMALEVMEDCPPFHLKGDLIMQSQIHNYVCVATLTNKIFNHLKTQTNASKDSQKQNDYPNQPARSKDDLRRQFMPKGAAPHASKSGTIPTFVIRDGGIHNQHGDWSTGTNRTPEREVPAASDHKDRQHKELADNRRT